MTQLHQRQLQVGVIFCAFKSHLALPTGIFGVCGEKFYCHSESVKNGKLHNCFFLIYVFSGISCHNVSVSHSLIHILRPSELKLNVV